MAKRTANEEASNKPKKDFSNSVAKKFINIAEELNFKLNELNFLKKIAFVYNPTVYAQTSYHVYINKYCSTSKQIMFLGMNPGPWGMSQTGIPFGEVEAVKNWLNINEPVLKPDKEHPSRPVLGFSCQKSEVSGKRFWKLMKEISREADVFFKNCFIYNYLPLQFINAQGKNLPPTTLNPVDQQQIFKVCDEALGQVISLYNVHTVVGIGKFAESRAKYVVSKLKNSKLKVVSILHPSPQSKAANNWHEDAYKQLKDLHILPLLEQKT